MSLGLIIDTMIESKQIEEETVRNLLRDAFESVLHGNGNGKRKRGRLNVDNGEFKKLYLSHTAKELASRFEVSPQTIAVKASKLGIKKRGNKADIAKPKKAKKVKKSAPKVSVMVERAE